MASPQQNVLVFGPTGGVGGAAAVEAHRRGATVWLGMRDTSKAIAEIDEATISAPDSRYKRVQADLSQPESLAAAVKQSGATTAFVYTMFATQDYMRSSFDALKSAGIAYVVLLSSYMAGALVQEGEPPSFINVVHASVENSLKDSGIPHALLRPAYFNTNLLREAKAISGDEDVGVFCPDVEFDFIAPPDIGAVAGNILAKQAAADADRASVIIDLCGPKMYSQRDSFGVVAASIGREIKVKEIDEAEWYEKNSFMPRHVLDSLCNGFRKAAAGHSEYPKERYEFAAANLAKYLEREPTSLAEWAKANKKAFGQ